MNAGPAETHSPVELPPAEGWSWTKICLVILLALAAHVAFVFFLGAKKAVTPRAVTNVPVFHLADNTSELVRLTDPTWFALPHPEDLASTIWSSPLANKRPSFSWAEPPPPAFLAPDAGTLGTSFKAFMQTNRFAPVLLNYKPEPQLLSPQIMIESVLPQNSTWQLSGEITGRRLLNTLSAPPQAVNDVIAPSRVQLLVDMDGSVASAVLVDASGYDAADHYAPADQQALELARTLRFAPADKLMFGEIVFNWHTVPTNAP